MGTLTLKLTFKENDELLISAITDALATTEGVEDVEVLEKKGVSGLLKDYLSGNQDYIDAPIGTRVWENGRTGYFWQKLDVDFWGRDGSTTMKESTRHFNAQRFIIP